MIAKMSLERARVLCVEECLRLLSEQQIGRLGISIGALPVIVPVNFILDERVIRFRTLEGTKFAAATSNSVVAFEVDSYNTEERNGYSVLVQGIANEVKDDDVRRQVLDAIPQPLGTSQDAQCVVAITIEFISGRMFEDGESTDSR